MSSPRPKTRAQAPKPRAQTPATRAQAKAQGGGASKGKTPDSRRRTWAKRLGLAALIAGLLLVIGFFVAYAVTPVPSPNELANAQASIIYYADGKTEMDRISEVNRESVPLSQVPEAVQQAHLAAEDRNFYENSGISPTGILRGAWVTLRGGTTQSGSTITQQYVKNYFLTQDQTLTRKGKEILISIKIGKQHSKDQILEDYLNTIYYGRGAYGIQTAAKAYFNKDVSKLTPSEGALLASVIKGPSYFDPGLGAEQKANAQARWTYVMDGMVSEGWISEADRAKAQFPKVVTYRPNRGASGPTGYLTQQVKQELRTKLKLTDADIDRGGYRIVTTIDKRAQDAAVKAVKERMPQGAAGKDLHVGLTSIRPGDGAVVAMYGGADYQKVQFNTATDAKLQAGSTFKVFTLIAGLQDEISTKTRFNGKSPQFFEEFEDPAASTAFARRGGVENFSDEQFGNIDLKTATGHSVNTVYAQLNIEVGPEKTKEAAVTAGLPAKGLDDNYANVFGTDTVSVKDMANAYATIAAQGVRVSPYMIKTVKGGPGDLDYQAKAAKKGVFDKGVMADTIDAMEEPIKDGTAQFAQNLGRPAAGKTGTTTDNKSAWFDGFTPQLATAVGIYKGDGTKSMSNLAGFGELTGGTVPVRIWTDYMDAALKGQKVVDFPEREGIGDDEVVTPTTSTTTKPTTTTTTKPTTTTTTTTQPPTTQPRPTTTTTAPGPTKTTKTREPGPPTPTGTITILGDRPGSSPTTG